MSWVSLGWGWILRHGSVWPFQQVKVNLHPSHLAIRSSAPCPDIGVAIKQCLQFEWSDFEIRRNLLYLKNIKDLSAPSMSSHCHQLRFLDAELCYSLFGKTAVGDKSSYCPNWPCKLSPMHKAVSWPFWKKSPSCPRYFVPYKERTLGGPSKSSLIPAQPPENFLSF